MNLPGISRFCALTGLSVLLLAACGPHQGTISAESSSPSTGITASPPIEGTGPESPQPSRANGDGGVAIPMAGLPIGNNSESDLPNGECIEVIWKGQPPSGANVVTVTAVAVATGPFLPVQAATDCPDGPGCVNYLITAATISRASCYAEVEYTGPPVTDPNAPGIDGTLTLTGKLTCPDGGVAACHQDSLGIQGSGVTSIRFEAEIAPPGSAGAGSSPPESPDSSTPAAAGSP